MSRPGNAEPFTHKRHLPHSDLMIRDRAVRRLAVLSALLAVGILILLAAGTALVALAATTAAPQSCLIRVENPSGAIWWARFTGTGSGGLSPLEEGVCGHGPLLVDGASLRPSGCGSFAQPCVLLWPASPQSP